jgi:NitT/TauT family transport system permease protein
MHRIVNTSSRTTCERHNGVIGPYSTSKAGTEIEMFRMIAQMFARTAKTTPGDARSSRQATYTPWAIIGLRVVSLILLFAFWYAVSLTMSTDIVPTPGMTLQAFQEALVDGYIWSDLLITFSRMLGAFFLAMLIGLSFGSALGTISWFERIFDIWVTIAAAIPGVLYLVVIYLWLGLNDRAAILGGALVVAPSVTFNIWQGMKSLDTGLSEMARAFDVDNWTIFRRVLLPQTLPFLFASARLGLALTWKIIMFVELLGRSSGVGYRIEYWYQLFNMRRVLASALLFVLVMLLIELVVLRHLEHYLFRWRREEAR